MNFANLKRAMFLLRFVRIIAICFFGRVLVQIFWIKSGVLESVFNYLIMVIFHSLVYQIVKAEQISNVNKLSITEILFFIGLCLATVLIALNPSLIAI